MYVVCQGTGSTGGCPFGTGIFATFDPTFGTPSDLSNGFFFRERQIQLAARFEF
jgi:hypothetical protein